MDATVVRNEIIPVTPVERFDHKVLDPLKGIPRNDEGKYDFSGTGLSFLKDGPPRQAFETSLRATPMEDAQSSQDSLPADVQTARADGKIGSHIDAEIAAAFPSIDTEQSAVVKAFLLDVCKNARDPDNPSGDPLPIERVNPEKTQHRYRGLIQTLGKALTREQLKKLAPVVETSSDKEIQLLAERIREEGFGILQGKFFETEGQITTRDAGFPLTMFNLVKGFAPSEEVVALPSYSLSIMNEQLGKIINGDISHFPVFKQLIANRFDPDTNASYDVRMNQGMIIYRHVTTKMEQATSRKGKEIVPMTYNGKFPPEGWVNYVYYIPAYSPELSADNQSRTGGEVTLSIAVSAEISQDIDKHFGTDPSFFTNLFDGLYPGYIGKSVRPCMAKSIGVLDLRENPSNMTPVQRQFDNPLVYPIPAEFLRQQQVERLTDASSGKREVGDMSVQELGKAFSSRLPTDTKDYLAQAAAVIADTEAFRRGEIVTEEQIRAAFRAHDVDRQVLLKLLQENRMLREGIPQVTDSQVVEKALSLGFGKDNDYRDSSGNFLPEQDLNEMVQYQFGKFLFNHALSLGIDDPRQINPQTYTKLLENGFSADDIEILRAYPNEFLTIENELKGLVSNPSVSTSTMAFVLGKIADYDGGRQFGHTANTERLEQADFEAVGVPPDSIFGVNRDPDVPRPKRKLISTFPTALKTSGNQITIEQADNAQTRIEIARNILKNDLRISGIYLTGPSSSTGGIMKAEFDESTLSGYIDMEAMRGEVRDFGVYLLDAHIARANRLTRRYELQQYLSKIRNDPVIIRNEFESQRSFYQKLGYLQDEK